MFSIRHPRLAIAGAACSFLLLTACGGSGSSSGPATGEPPPDLSDLDLSSAEYCDLTVTARCLYPFPNNYFTKADAATPTGLRVNFQRQAMPIAQPVAIDANPYAPTGVHTTEATPVDPAEWNRNDGFSPGAMIQTWTGNVDLEASGAVTIDDLSKAMDTDAPVLLLDAETGERQLIWVEMDANASSTEGRALLIRPARNLLEGRTYIVALRNLVDDQGEALEASALFKAYRDGQDTGEPVLEARRESMNTLFASLESHGIARRDLIQAWTFTVASQKNLTERLLHIRDQAFANLGGGAPAFTIDQVGTDIEGKPRSGLSRGITGTFEVPNFLNKTGGVPGASFNYSGNNAPDALPEQWNGDDTLTARFRCQVPDSTVQDFSDPDSPVTPARPALYGHGLFGEGPGGEFRSGNVRAMQTEHNILFCATDWIGMAQEDFIAGVIHHILADISLLPRQLDRSQQGLLNAMFLAELLRHPDGFASDPAFHHGPDNTLIHDPTEVFYDGNSQGGILGGALIATAPNLHRGVLGVPGSNYSLLLRRYGPFNERFGVILNQAYPNELDRSLVLGLMQMLWDRAENNGYLSHLAGRSLPGTPTGKRVLLHPALGDHLVTTWSAEIMARTIGAAMHEPTARLGEHPDTVPYVDIERIQQYPYHGHALMVWDSGAHDPDSGHGTPYAPLTNTGPSAGEDPHESPRNTVSARQQKSAFLEQFGSVIDVCGESPCYTDDYTGLSRD
ncbi:hypothetical protein [Alcanivorax sp. 24]|uniref:hypothetical protein n=1 Tax=Alcanivorax sp. 24 TaxID=2545266 RepID=UPI00105EBD91|nr:hypothetical protein [Alcanivorax sp. 24]